MCRRAGYVRQYVPDILYPTVFSHIRGSFVVSDSYYDLENDIREMEPVEVPMLHFNAAFVRMKERHLELKEKYPDKPQAHGPAFTGISNARPETKELEVLYKGY